MPLGISLFSAYFHEHGILKYVQQKNENLINYRENELQVFMLKMPITFLKLPPKQNAEIAISLMCMLDQLRLVIKDHKIMAIIEFLQTRPSALYIYTLASLLNYTIFIPLNSTDTLLDSLEPN